jgi:RNA recognition motif-containing protein
MGTKLFVGNLAYSITEQELREAFAGPAGRTVQSVRIALDRETQRPRGFAFVELVSDADADAAIKELNGQMLNGRSVFVEKAQERVPGAPRPPRPAGAPGGPGGYRGAGGPGGGPGGGGFRPGGPGGGGFGRPRFAPPMASMETNKEDQRRRQSRPEKQRNDRKRPGEGRPKEEDRERGKWRWDGSDD